MAEKALQIEAMTARRHVKALNNDLKIPVPRIPSVLAYLRWLDKMDAWHGRRTTMQQTSARLRDTEELYSWNGNFGNPVVLPRIRKHPKPEKYHSDQIERAMYDPALPRKTSSNNNHIDYEEEIRKKQAERRFRIAQSYAVAGASTSAPPMNTRTSGHSKASSKDIREGGKHTKFYIHAMNGFKYWPNEIYNPPIHHTKYSFGNQFNPGRVGVVNDRIYVRPRANKHYWTDFQLRQNPIGSGNTVTGKVLSN